MMMGNHMMTSAFMTQRRCTASSFMHGKPDGWVEYNARTGIGVSLKDARPNTYQ